MVHDFLGTEATSKILEEAGLASSTFYYKAKSARSGRAASTHTLKTDGSCVSNDELVSQIKALLGKEFVCYGYHKVTHHLKQAGYVINKKKVYRLMKEESLLLPKRIKTHGKRDFVKILVVKPTAPNMYLQMDIKYFWIAGERRNVYLLSVIDLFSRSVLGSRLGRSIRKRDVLFLLGEVFSDFKHLKGVCLRCDNGSQFLAYKVRDYLSQAGVYQEFTHIATPQENGHIEALHSILEYEIERRFEFETFEDLKATLKRYFDFYNKERLHSSIGFLSPQRFLDQYYAKEAINELENSLLEDLNLNVNI